jgi:EAL domain-containing protein (putative c-di-GMP-specific phosphodiesterase class I)
MIPPDEGSDENLLMHADLAMYQVKEHGKNGWEFFEPAMTETLEKAHRIKKELERSLQEDRFVLYYQPQVEMASGRLVGVEAVLRWDHPDRGLLEPESFIEVLEGCKLAVDLGKWVLEQILSQIQDWKNQGFSPKVHMHIGSRYLLSGSFIKDLHEAFARHPGIHPEALELDIRETKSFHEIQKVKSIFNACRLFGIPISIGNIESEYGSLAYIQSLGVDRVTIDQKFVRNLPKSPQDMAIVASLVTTARLLVIDVIGEGIETEEEGNLLLKWGCSIGQGVAIAPPMLPEKIPDWAKQYRPFDSWSHWKDVPWDPKIYPLLMAREAARVVIRNLMEGLEIPGEMRVEWINSHRCLQGRWIDKEGQSLYGKTLEFRKYREAHEHLHSLIREALVARDTGATPTLDELKRSIRDVAEDLNRRLDQILSLDLD